MVNVYLMHMVSFSVTVERGTKPRREDGKE